MYQDARGIYVDPRRAQGKRHDLPLVLTLALLVLCCGHLSYEAMEEWCENYQEELKNHVSFLSGHMPDTAPFHRVFARLDVGALEAVLESGCKQSHHFQKEKE